MFSHELDEHTAIERHVRNTAAALPVPLTATQEDQAVLLAGAWYDAARRQGLDRADVDAAGALVLIAVSAVRLAGPRPEHTWALPDPPARPPAGSHGVRTIWFSTAQAAEYTGRHPVTLRRALETGALHGSQSDAGSTWRIHTDCLEAWLLNRQCPHITGGQA